MSSLTQRIQDWTVRREAAAVGLAQQLVRIPSENHPPSGDEAAVQAYYAEYMAGIGAEVHVYELSEVEGLTSHVSYMAGRNYEGRPNVYGRFAGKGGGRSLVFSGHADTVYRGTEQWTYGPFSGEIVDGKLYGRGSYDMKGGMAAAICAVQCLQELGVKLKGDVFVESVIDEEHGGANGTLAGRLYGPHADMAIIPEPTNLRINPAHLGGGIWKAEFAGKSGISFNGEVLVSALEAMVQFAGLLRRFEVRLNELYTPPIWWSADRRLTVVALTMLSGDTTREFQEKVPATAEMNFWIEGYPGMTGKQIIEELWKFYEEQLDAIPELKVCRPIITPKIRYLLASEMGDSESVKQFLDIVGRTGHAALGRDPGPAVGTPFACDGFMFNVYSSTPALVLGPAGENAHAPDEYMNLASYSELIRWYAHIIADWCGMAEDAGGEAQ
ncbi:M20 family metallopeptidase [Paenibacillus koleovorans]|uniref:M20 family metallopeptidase n=1 Tax=Paenibacillus koleovorans TaxID=121608 RepID=UPI000FDB4B19|nr:M20/M25/M40 family metallo-hydrolase [Paenibacillus koleovorans]